MLDPTTAGLIGIAVMMILIFLKVPVGASLGIVGFGGLACLLGMGYGLANMSVIPFSEINSYTLSVIPLFLLMGTLVAEAGVAQDAYIAARAWTVQIKGGLAMATVLACGLFAAVCGSSTATAVTFGRVAYPEMRKLGYGPRLAIGCIASAGTLGILIPPSMGFILYGILTEVSIGKLFIAGIIPGILEVVFYITTIYIVCKFRPQLGPSVSTTTFVQKVASLKDIWAVIVLFLLVIGGIYGGIFSPTEAGGVGAFGALIIGLAKRKYSHASLFNAFKDTGRTTAMMITLIIGTFIFMKFLAITNIPFVASEFVVRLPLSRLSILAIILICYIVFGCFFDIYAVIILTTPIIFPVMMSLGFDAIWYGVIMVRMIEIGLITPPFGMNLFVLKGVIDAPMGTMYRGVLPFFVADILHVSLLVAFPVLSTYLPSIM